jgi:hypothetical protein
VSSRITHSERRFHLGCCTGHTSPRSRSILLRTRYVPPLGNVPLTDSDGQPHEHHSSFASDSIIDDDDDNDNNDNNDNEPIVQTIPEPIVQTMSKKFFYNKDGIRYWQVPKRFTKTSKIWKYGEEVHASEPGKPNKGKKWWMCLKCLRQGRKPKLEAANSTTKAMKHLAKEHNIWLFSIKEETKPEEEAPIYVPDPEKLRTAMALLLSVNHVSFQFFETEQWQDFCHLMNPHAANLIPKTADSAKNMTKKVFEKQKTEVRKLLEKSPHKVCLSFDAWTSPNKYGMLGVVANWSDGNSTSRALLGLTDIEGKHTGPNIAKCIDKIESDFGVKRERVVAHVVDHAANNGTTIEALGDHDRTTQVFCVGHTFNLSARTFLKRLDEIPALNLNDTDNNDGDDNGDAGEDDDNDGDTFMGPVAKIRELANHLSRSTHLMQLWDTAFKKRIAYDNKTRWNSTLTMIQSVKSQFAVPWLINDFLETADVDSKMAAKLAALTLSGEEWSLLDDIQKLLSPFAKWTKILEGATYLLH